MPQDPYLPPGCSQRGIPGDAAGDEEGDVCLNCGQPVCDEAIGLPETGEIYCCPECMAEQRMSQYLASISAEAARLGGDTQKIKAALRRAYKQGVDDATEVYDV